MPARDSNHMIKHVALLGRPGPARDRLREAIGLAGAKIILEDEPLSLDKQQIQNIHSNATAIIIVLEPSIENALAQLQSTFDRPDLIVMFEEAESAARREGWEAQRWIRHLAAKLYGHTHVLPPILSSGVEQSSRDPIIHDITLPSPVASSLPANSTPPVSGASSRPGNVAGSVHQERSHHSQPSQPSGSAQQHAPQTAASPSDHDAAHVSPHSRAHTGEFSPLEPSATQPVVRTFEDRRKNPVSDRRQSGVRTPMDERAERPMSSRSPSPTEAPAHQHSLHAAKTQVEGQNSGTSVQNTPRLVIALAGVGGPEALRRILIELPTNFQQTMIITMALDPAQCANLTRQMQRVCGLPVLLAAGEGEVVKQRTVYVLPGHLGIRQRKGQFEFVYDAMTHIWLGALPAKECAILVLSGVGEPVIPTLLSLQARGAWVAAQNAESCYDPTAARKMIEKGCMSGESEQLAKELIKLLQSTHE